MKEQPDTSFSFDRKIASRRFFPVLTGLYRQSLVTAAAGRPGTISQWMMEFCSADAGEIHLLGPGLPARRLRRAGTVHIYAPGCLLREDTRGAVIPFRETCLKFDGGENCVLERLFRPGTRYCLVTDRRGVLGALMSEAVEHCLSRGESAFWLAQSIFCRCLDLLTCFAVRTDADTWEIEAEPSPDRLFVQASEAFMRRNVSARLRNADIAAFLGISESGFSHRFRRLAGVSPGARLLEIRLETARNLLLKGEKLKTIAAATGFSDEFHLSRSFRRQTGLSPRDFRRANG